MRFIHTAAAALAAVLLAGCASSAPAALDGASSAPAMTAPAAAAPATTAPAVSAPSAAPVASSGKGFPRALRSVDRGLFRQYTNAQLTDVLAQICGARSAGEGNQGITRDLISRGYDIDAVPAMVMVAPDYC